MRFLHEILRKIQILVRYRLSLFTYFAAILLSLMPHQLSLLVDSNITGLDKPVGLQKIKAAIISRQPKHKVDKVVRPTQQL
jgi:hypothetical protein